MQKYTLSSGKVIKIVPEVDPGTCTGCVGKDGGLDYDCDEISKRFNCRTGVIAVSINDELPKSGEQKYTIEEVLAAWSNVSGFSINKADIDNVKNDLFLKTDPEYQEYLRLKEKFENED